MFDQRSALRAEALLLSNLGPVKVRYLHTVWVFEGPPASSSTSRSVTIEAGFHFLSKMSRIERR